MISRLIVTTMVAFFIVMFSGACVWEIATSVERHARNSKIQDAKAELHIAKLEAQKKKLSSGKVCSVVVKGK